MYTLRPLTSILPSANNLILWTYSLCSCFTILESYNQPFVPLFNTTLVGTLNFSEATFNPGAFSLLEIITEGMTFLILPDFIPDRIAFMLLPLPEMSIPMFIKDSLDIQADP